MTDRKAEIVINEDYKIISRDKIRSICEDLNCEYAFIFHDKDILENGQPKTKHWHIFLRFKDPRPFETFANYFDVSVNNVNKVQKWSSAIAYLTHKNAPDKYQYDNDEVTANFDFKVVAQKIDKKKIINDILQKIDNFEIREFNLYEKIDIETFATYKTKILNAIQYQKNKVVMSKDRKINVVFLSGDTGTGKTTFAKEYCKKLNLSYCVSSSSNDPLQDYKCEDVLILDDLRDNDFKFTDLLKILDTHTQSSITSRYNNKFFVGQTIIITSYARLTSWYKNIEDKALIQLYRRIKEYYIFDKSKIEIYKYNENTCFYKLIGQCENTYNKFDKQEEDNISLFQKMDINLNKNKIAVQFELITDKQELSKWPF